LHLSAVNHFLNFIHNSHLSYICRIAAPPAAKYTLREDETQCIALHFIAGEGAGMAYPELGSRIDIVQKKHKIDTAKLAQKLSKEKTTAWRWLQSPHKLRDGQQNLLVEAICEVLKEGGVEISTDVFRTNNTLDFCSDLGFSKSEAAAMTGRHVPVPDIFVESVFQPAAMRKAFVGSYILFKHDKTRERRDRPYIQAHCEITMDGNDRLKYDERWSGSEGLPSYTGFVVTAGTVTNIIGQQNTSDPQHVPEVFWCGLKRVADKSGNAIRLYGYRSEVTRQGVLFADRVVLVRLSERPANLSGFEPLVSRSRAAQTAGENMLKYLDDWKDSSIGEPTFS
jgi:hypothetical protein